MTMSKTAKLAAIACWVIGAAILGGSVSESRAEPQKPKSFLYIITNPSGPNGVEAFSRDRATGHLVRIGRFATGGSGDPIVGGLEQHALISDGNHLYAVNPGSDNVSAFRIADTGALQLIGVVPSNGKRPVSLALNKNLLYVANEGNQPGEGPARASFSGYRVQNDGSLLPIPGSTFDLTPGDAPADLGFDKTGQFLFAGRLAGNLIDSFQVDKGGFLTGQKTIPGRGGVFGLRVSRREPTTLLVTLALPEFFPDEDAPGLALYNVGRGGDLQHVNTFTDPDKSDAGFRDPCWLAATSDERHVWISSFIPRVLTLFSVDPQGVRKVSVFNPQDSEQEPDPANPAGPPINVVIGSTDIEITQDERFLYQLRAFNVPDGLTPVVPRIAVLRLTGNFAVNAGVEPVETVLLPNDLPGAGVMGLAIVER